MDSSQIISSPIGIVLLIIGSAVVAAALVSVIIQLYKSHVSDKSMRREFAGTDKAEQKKYRPVPKKFKALEERFRELDIPPVYSFTGNCHSENFMITAKRVCLIYICSHTLNGEVLDKKVFINCEKAVQYIFREVMDIVLNSYGEEGYKAYTSQSSMPEKGLCSVYEPPASNCI